MYIVHLNYHFAKSRRQRYYFVRYVESSQFTLEIKSRRCSVSVIKTARNDDLVTFHFVYRSYPFNAETIDN